MTTPDPNAPRKRRRSFAYKPGARKRQACHSTHGKASRHPASRDSLKLVIMVSMGEVAIKETGSFREATGRASQAQSLSHCQKARDVPKAIPIRDWTRRPRSSRTWSQKEVASGFNGRESGLGCIRVFRLFQGLGILGGLRSVGIDGSFEFLDALAESLGDFGNAARPEQEEDDDQDDDQFHGS